MNELRAFAPMAAASRLAFALLLVAVPACTDKERVIPRS